MFESLAMYSLASGAEEQRIHSQNFQTSGLEKYSKGSPIDGDTNFLVQRCKERRQAPAAPLN